ncbi:tRNA (guanine-N1)-methyltransferase [Besnoitia besnoiti]|uniref:tRNA (guanine(9)-N(1))-methyltransferase n=1 Tax=Besnoitia besnoiti TaxID=94643 RepID=A0A2A9M8U4_BESBE|nr:tRNA (guanine-N1)-methyltransferase [Besnoitia besnoiti]PFH34395.1 tRNA (guanine-N1)-methyltransferase [Besnoitia besnoiti]
MASSPPCVARDSSSLDRRKAEILGALGSPPFAVSSNAGPSASDSSCGSSPVSASHSSSAVPTVSPPASDAMSLPSFSCSSSPPLSVAPAKAPHAAGGLSESAEMEGHAKATTERENTALLSGTVEAGTGGGAAEAKDADGAGADGKRLPRSQKKWLKRAEYREKKREKRPEERRRRRKERRNQMLKETQHLTEEERTAFVKKRKEESRTERAALLVRSPGGMPRVCFNCSFESLMNDKEVRSLAKQLFISYHLVRGAPQVPMQLHFASFTDDNAVFKACRDLFSFSSWVVRRHERPYWEVFSQEEVIVLSPDAEEELLSVEDDKVYIIGGLVDRTISRSETYRQAEAHRYETRKLPFNTFLPDQQRLVLNINTVVEILLHFRQHQDWTAALLAAVPQRLQGTGGRKKARLDKKRERREEIFNRDPNLREEAESRQARERQWCHGKGRCASFDDADPFDNPDSLAALSIFGDADGNGAGEERGGESAGGGKPSEADGTDDGKTLNALLAC